MIPYKIKNVSNIKYMGADILDKRLVKNTDIVPEIIPMSNWDLESKTLIKTTGYTMKQDFQLLLTGEVKVGSKRKRIKRLKTFDALTTMKKAIEAAKSEYKSIAKDEKTKLNTVKTEVDLYDTDTITVDTLFIDAFNLYLRYRGSVYKSKGRAIPMGRLEGKAVDFAEDRSFANKYMKSIFNKTLGSIRKSHLIAIKGNMGDMAARTKHKVFQIVNPVYVYAMQENEDLVLRSPALMTKDDKFTNNRDIHLSLEQKRLLMNRLYNMNNPTIAGVFTFLMHGRRAGETLSLEWNTIDFKNKTYTVIAENNKAKTNMTHPLTDRLITKLEEIGIKKKGYVFTGLTNDDDKLSSATLREYWIKAREVVGEWKLNDISGTAAELLHMHDIRHVIGGHLASNHTSSKGIRPGISIDIIGGVLGHTPVKSDNITTRYSSIDTATVAAAINTFTDEVLDNV